MPIIPIEVKPLEEVNPALIDPLFEQKPYAGLDERAKTVFSIGQLTANEALGFSNQSFSEGFLQEKSRDSQPILIVENGIVRAYQIPNRFLQFGDVITKIAEHEYSAYPGAEYENIKMTAHQNLVKEGKAQRGDCRTWHRDSRRDGLWKHIYTVADVAPPEFETGFDAKPYDIIFTNSEVSHRSPRMPRTSIRTFFRLAYTHKLLKS